MILVLDYGMSNLRSVSKAIEAWGGKPRVSGSPADLRTADKVILPGVGAFGDAMKELNQRGMTGAIRDYVVSGKPFLGICLGLQLLFEASEENPGIQGLGILKGTVKRFSPEMGLKVPHMGWNRILLKKKDCPLTAGIADQSHVYFVHSYYVKPDDSGAVLAECDYGGRFVSMVWKNSVYGAQFHPEKSQETGLRMLQNFVNL